MRDYLDTLCQLGLRGSPASPTALKQSYPSFAADAHVWVRHSLALLEGKDLRLRRTTIDNAPAGREVHWNSAWAWCIAGAGWLHHLFTGYPIENSVERATIWLNPFTQFILMLVLSSWATKRGGVILGAVVALAMTFSDRMYEGFFPSYVDHHGLLMVSVLGTVLGAVFMGGGWWLAGEAGTPHILPQTPDAAQKAAIFSAIAGACGLWISAASVIPPIALIGISGLLTTVLQGRTSQSSGARFDPKTWRIWGRVGAASSLFFYLIEYFPQHMGMRLEPNHPLHAIAWLGGGELVAQLSERWLAPRDQRWTNLRQLVWPILAVCAAPGAVVIGGAKVFVVADPFMSRLHNDYIQEFLPLWRTFRLFDRASLLQVAGLGSVPLIAAIATLTYKRRAAPIVLWFATIVGTLLVIMAVWQSRWLLNASAALICLDLVVLVVWTSTLRLSLRWTSAVALAGALFVAGAYHRYQGSVAQLASKQVSPQDAASAFNRDIAAILRASQPTGEITLLTSPNSSTTVGYFGRFKTLGTLYWENSAGLKAAASILAAKSDSEAATLIKAHGVTHVALILEENFIEQYFRLLNPGATTEQIRQCFGFRILYEKVVPTWLQMIPYSVPPDLAILKPVVMLFKVNFNQTIPEALYNVALAQIASGAIDEGERSLDAVIRQMPAWPEPLLRKGELLVARRAWNDAAQTFLKGISLSPPQARAELYIAFAGALYNQQQHTIAANIYRTALGERPNDEIASYLAWVLATSKEDSVRNGSEAYEIAQKIIKAQPNNAAYFSVLAAALAELGRYPEAVDAANRAVANARLKNEISVGIHLQRLETLKSGKPIRN